MRRVKGVEKLGKYKRRLYDWVEGSGEEDFEVFWGKIKGGEFGESCKRDTAKEIWILAGKGAPGKYSGALDDAAIVRGRKDVVWFIENVCRIELTGSQREVAESFVGNSNVAVMSHVGFGKTTLAAALAYWEVKCWGGTVYAVSGLSMKQFLETFWKEFRKLVLRTGNEADIECLQKDRWFPDFKRNPEKGVACINADEENKIQGIHGERVTLLIDEAALVPQGFYDVLQGAVASEDIGHTRLLLLGNPNYSSGYFAERFSYKDRYDGLDYYDEYQMLPAEGWTTLRYSAFDHDNIIGKRRIGGLIGRSWIVKQAKEWAGIYIPRDMKMADKWEKVVAEKDNSNDMNWRVRIMGKFPSSASENRIITEDLIMQLTTGEPVVDTLGGNDTYSVVAGFDIASTGEDNSVGCVLTNGRVTCLKALTGKRSIVEVVDWIENFVLENGVMHFGVDSTGWGSAVYDLLVHRGHSVYGVHFAEKSTREDAHDKRTEVAMDTADKIRADMIKCPNIEHFRFLFDDIRSMMYTLDENSGKLRLVSKNETRKLLKRSPDYFEAFEIASVGLGSVRAYTSDELVEARFEDALALFSVMGQDAGVF